MHRADLTEPKRELSIPIEVLNGMATGCAVLAGFGLVWILMGMLGGGDAPRLLEIGLAAAGVALVVWVAWQFVRIARFSRKSGAAPPSGEKGKEIGKRLGYINLFQWIAIGVIVLVFAFTGYGPYIPAAIAVVVGLHFFPLARLFAFRTYSVVGVLGCAIGVAGFFIAPAPARLRFVGLSFGIVLWLTAGYLLVRLSVLLSRAEVKAAGD